MTKTAQIRTEGGEVLATVTELNIVITMVEAIAGVCTDDIVEVYIGGSVVAFYDVSFGWGDKAGPMEAEAVAVSIMCAE